VSEERVAPRELRDFLLSQGRPWITLEDAAVLLGTSEPVAADALAYLREAHQFFSPSPGLYVPLPPEYKSWGALPAADFIDPLMTHLGHGYYVGLLSAAELHGAAHQRPQAFQVVTDARVRDRELGRARLRFYVSAVAKDVPTQRMNAATGQICVSTPATTALDLVARPSAAGGLNNVATVLYELADEGLLTASGWSASAPWYPTAVLRRTGWLLDHVGAAAGQDGLLDVAGKPGPRVYLEPAVAHRGSAANRWNLVVNIDVEPDL
jgi:predicted transcriptional regulator of viral defense system